MVISNIYSRQWKYLFEFNETFHWTAMRKFYRFQIKVYLKDIFNETIYLIQLNIELTGPCPPTVVDGASVVFSRNRVKRRWRCSKHCCVYLRVSFRVIYVMCYFDMCYVCYVLLLCLNAPFVYVLLKMFLIMLYINDFLCCCVIWLVLFRGFTKQTRLLGSNKILIDSMLPNFIDTLVIQIKDIIESNRLFHWRQINIL